jgi:hypothetical protein
MKVRMKVFSPRPGITATAVQRWGAYQDRRKNLPSFMTDATLPCAPRPASSGEQQEASLTPCSRKNSGAASEAALEQYPAGRYFMLAPDGTNLTIPKELYVALSDFLKTRKCPGSITIQFRSGDILCVEAVAKKTFRNQSNTLE